MSAIEAAKKQLNGGAADWLIRAAIGAAIVWGFTQVDALYDTVALNTVTIRGIQSNRFTNADGNAIRSEQAIHIATMEERLGDIRALLETKADSKNVPPDDVRRDLDRIDKAIERLRRFHEN